MRLQVLVIIIGALIFVAPASHAAHCDKNGLAGNGFVGVAIECRHADEAATPSTELATYPSGAEFRYVPFCDREAGRVDDALFGCGAPLSCGPGEQGVLHKEVLFVPGEGEREIGTVCLDDVIQGTQPALTQAVIMRAFERVPLPEAQLSVQPPGGKTLVGLDTILSTVAEPFTESVTLLGRRVDLDIEPREFVWSHGDGTSQTTDDPGQPYREGLPMSGYVSHRFADLGVFDLAVDVVWGARFRVNGGPWQDVGDTITMSSSPDAVEVVEAQPNLVGGRR